MIRAPRSVILVHGAALILVGLLLGLAAVVEELVGPRQAWRAAHSALLVAGVWLLAIAAVWPLLVLPPGHRLALGWALLATVYAFTTAIVVQAATGVRALAPQGSWTSWVAYVANLVTVGAGFVAALLTLLGAVSALKSGRAE